MEPLVRIGQGAYERTYYGVRGQMVEALSVAMDRAMAAASEPLECVACCVDSAVGDVCSKCNHWTCPSCQRWNGPDADMVCKECRAIDRYPRSDELDEREFLGGAM
jgi:hypothetical protein